MLLMGYKVRDVSFALGNNSGRRPTEAQDCFGRRQNYLTKAKQTKLKMPFNGNNYLTAILPECLG